MMEVRKKEFKKLVCHPIIWCLMLLFLAFNCFQIWQNIDYSGMDQDLKGLHSVMTDTGMNLPENKQNILKLKKYGSGLEKFYANNAEKSGELYENLDMQLIKKQKQKFSSYYPTGSFAEFIDNNYAKIQKRVNEIKSDGDGNYAFYPGYYYKIHSMMYENLLQPLALQMAVIMVLSILFLMDYERIQKTRDIVLVSKSGKRLMGIKVQMGVLSGLMFSSLLLILSLAVFFLKVSFEGLWKVPVCSAMLAETRGMLYYPFITFWKLNVGQYLALSIVIAIFLALLAGLFSASLQMFLKNSYLAFVLEVLIFLAMFTLTFEKTVTWFDILIDLNPTCTWYMCGAWFMGNSVWMSFPGTEFMSIALTGVIVSILVWLGWKRYSTQDIK